MASDRRLEVNRAAREHLERMSERLASGRARLERLHESIEDTNRHLESISDWIAETEQALAEDRKRRSSSGEQKRYSWKTGST
jgi:chromosome segregation ATPase